MRRVFDATGAERIAGADLLKALLEDEERPWSTFNAGKPMSQSQLARRLASFGIVSRSVRLTSGHARRGPGRR